MRSSHSIILLFAATIGCAVPAFAQVALPEDMVTHLKSATVFIKCRGGRLEGTGSGFLIHREGHMGYIVTNAHVLAAEYGAIRSVQVVFDSGSAHERQLPASIVVEDDDQDLAIIRVDEPTLPQPIALQMSKQVRETMPAIIIGYPFGEGLSLAHKNPAATISQGTVSSIRRDTTGEIALLQIDGDANPGNSGGPIVDNQGELLGIVVSGVQGTQIVMAIPPSRLDALVAGNVGNHKLINRSSEDNKCVVVEATAKLCDPFGQIQRVDLLVVAMDESLEARMAADKISDPIEPHGAEVLNMVIADDVASTTFKSCAHRPGLPNLYTGQFKFVRRDSSVHYSDRFSHYVRFETTPARRSSNDWLGGGKTRDAFPEPIATGNDVRGQDTVDEYAIVTKLHLGMDPEDVREVVMEPDGSFFYALSWRGVVSRICLPDLVETHRLELGTPVTSILRTQLGLLVVESGNAAGWLIDPSSLEVERKIALPLYSGSNSLATSPESEFFIYSKGGMWLYILDLARDNPLRTYRSHELAEQQGRRVRTSPKGTARLAFNHTTITPDGKYLLCTGGRALNRFRLSGQGLQYQEMGPPRNGSDDFQRNQPLVISPDSKYVLVPDKHEGQNTLDVYRVEDLQEPLLELPLGRLSVQTAVFDKETQSVFVATPQHIAQFDSNGSNIRNYHLPPVERKGRHGYGFRQLLAHPSGHRLLVRTERGVFWLDAQERATTSARLLKSRALSEKLVELRIAYPDVQVVKLSISAQEYPQGFMSPDGYFCYILEDRKTLRKIRLPTCVQERVLEISHWARSAAMSSEGIVISVPDLGELWIIDQDSLDVRKRIAAPDIFELASSADSSVVLSLTMGRQELSVIDVKRGEYLYAAKIKDLLVPESNARRAVKKTEVIVDPNLRNKSKGDWHNAISSMSMTADGRYVFFRDREALYRFAIDGTDLILEEIGNLGSEFVGAKMFCGDGLLAVARFENHRRPGLDNRKRPQYSFVLYDISDLQRPITTINGKAIAFDDANRMIYTVYKVNNILEYDASGKQQRAYAVSMRGNPPPEFRNQRYTSLNKVQTVIAHPREHALLALTRHEVYWLELAEKPSSRR